MSADSREVGLYGYLPESVMIAIQDCGNSSHFLRKQPEIQFSGALLDQSPQERWRVDRSGRLVNGAASTTDLLLMAGHALALGNELFT